MLNLTLTSLRLNYFAISRLRVFRSFRSTNNILKKTFLSLRSFLGFNFDDRLIKFQTHPGLAPLPSTSATYALQCSRGRFSATFKQHFEALLHLFRRFMCLRPTKFSYNASLVILVLYHPDSRAYLESGGHCAMPPLLTLHFCKMEQMVPSD